MDEAWPSVPEDDKNEENIIDRIMDNLASVKKSASSSLKMLVERGERMDVLEIKASTLAHFAESMKDNIKWQRAGFVERWARCALLVFDTCLQVCGDCDCDEDSDRVRNEEK